MSDARGMGSHQSARMGKDEWLTPPELLGRLGAFDLDPCAPSYRLWPTAAAHFTATMDGLSLPWFGRVWRNPPYGQETETAMFFSQVWERADAILFLRGRLHFYHVDGKRASANAGAPSALIAYGDRNVLSLAESGIPGAFLEHWSVLI